MSAEEEKKSNKDENGDPFWSRILIVTIIVVWVALVAGNWIGHYMVKAGIFSKKTTAEGEEFRILPASKPVPWKQPMKPATPSSPPEKEFGETEISKVTETPDEVIETPSTETPELVTSPSVKLAATKKPVESPTPKTAATSKPLELLTPKPAETLKETDRVTPKPTPKETPEERPSPKPSTNPVQVSKPTPLLAHKNTPIEKLTPKPKPSAVPSSKPMPKEIPEEKPTPKSTDEATETQAGNFSLQCGSFKRSDYAQEQADKLRAKGYSPTIRKVGDEYKVYVGNYRDKKKAQDVESKMKEEGFQDVFITER